ncbi:MAG: hypothetical protein COY66_02415 [Candidatus Kerfeldbacteria bacterium CG_4_10_14_0_8_um_filter_42_10]|uniref:Methyltransferase type 11 domain-containing protein n=1 Tax=Candidatus Kerfeldbacteria bacterium CG_4_10_14_0_8_um_filter_42_10 TaxID=2014248 RepID=A0A2M7RJF1_9BACT|nr:MAG: hypothetical protein COY66_02415 [Candidatus Kerfeldbacteria bacterium CG_4_10_14_0_8_um_filter_42_10]
MNIAPDQLNELHSAVPPDYYDQGIQKNFFQKYWHEKRFKILPELLQGAGSKILDLGCHGGLMTSKIADYLKTTATGIDLSPKAIQYAQKKYPRLKFLAADIQKGIPFADNSFDAVTAFDVLEHIPNLKFVSQEIRRVLKPQGIFILAVPKENALFKTVWFFWTKGRGRVWHDAHVHQFDKHLLNNFFDSAGMQQVLEKKIHLGMYWIIKYQKTN